MEARFCDAWAHGFGWIAAAPGYLQRASHALAADGRVWVVDPVDFDGLDDRLRRLGEPAGVLQLFSRHGRDCAAVAERLGVRLLALPAVVPGSPFETFRLSAGEIALWWPEQRVLVCAEAVGTSRYYRAGSEPVGVHPLQRLRPPAPLLMLEPLHVLVGHGEGLHGPDAAAALRQAVRRSRRRAALLPLNLLPGR